MLLDDIKLSLRLTHNALDIEIKDLISSARMDLIQSGISANKANAEGTDIDPIDTLIKRAITVYCKANFGLDNKDSEKYQKSYDMLKQHLSLSTDYKEVIPDV